MVTDDQDHGQPIIIKRIKKGGHGHHGGSWKVAFADFMTAMMAFFLVLWLVGQDDQVKNAVAGYFQDPVGFTRGGKIGSGAGSGTMTGESSVLTRSAAKAVVKQMLEDAGQAIINNLQLSDQFRELMDDIIIEMTPEGLRIQIVEGADSSFFEAGSARMLPTGEAILYLVAEEVSKLPNRLVFEGHTDATGATNLYGYSNWDLGADRANFCRKVMLKAGVRIGQIKEVRSYADTQLLDPANPNDPRNRRVSILVLNDFDYVLDNNLIDPTQALESASDQEAYSMFQADSAAGAPATTASTVPADTIAKVNEDEFEVPAYLLDDSAD